MPWICWLTICILYTAMVPHADLQDTFEKRLHVLMYILFLGNSILVTHVKKFYYNY